MTEREKAIEECAALMDRWAADAKEFHDSVDCKIQHYVCRNAAVAIRNLKNK